MVPLWAALVHDNGMRQSAKKITQQFDPCGQIFASKEICGSIFVASMGVEAV